jgi:hypothetical protein
MFGFAGFAQLTGSWSANLNILPAVGLVNTTLALKYTVAGWTVTSTAKFTGAGFATLTFGASGALGPLTVTGNMAFDGTPAYVSADIKAALSFAGIDGYLQVKHKAAGDYGCQTGPSMLYTVYAKAAPVTLTVNFNDCCDGIEFKDLTLTLTGLGLCCGVTYDVTFYFTKAGFGYFELTAKDIFPICCGISFDAGVKFETDAKTVTLTPKFAGFGEACFELYADIATEGGVGEDLYLNAIRIDGWKIKCTLADCNYVEFVTFLSPENAGLYFNPVPFAEGEFEYIKLGFCGPGCCGGTYSVDIAVYFDNAGGLFGISRLGANMSIPVMANFTVKVGFATPDTLTLGWTFTF